MKQQSIAPMTAELARVPAWRNPSLVLGVLVVLAGATIPLWTENMPFMLMLACHGVIAALVAVSLDTLTGNTGLLSFGHAAWYGTGAYVAGLVAKHWTAEMAVVLPFTVMVAGVFAFAVGSVFVRQIGKTFAILTLAFSQVLFALVFIFSGITGGEDGLQAIPIPRLFGIPIVRQDVWFWLLYAILIVTICLLLYVRRSPLGRAWMGLKENTERAEFIGIDVRRLKLVAYLLSGCLGALAGGLYVMFNGATAPDTLHWFESGKILMYVVLGGVGTIIGPAVGAGIFTVAEHYVSSYTDAWLVYFGGLFVIIVIVAPGGIFGVFRPAWDRITGRAGGNGP